MSPPRGQVDWSFVVTVIYLNFLQLLSAPAISAIDQNEKPINMAAFQTKSSLDRPQQSSNLHFPQQNQKLAIRQIPQWFAPTPVSALHEPANVPTIINQNDASYLEKYLRNYFGTNDNVNQTPLNLGDNNDRAARTDSKILIPQKRQSDVNHIGNNDYSHRSRDTFQQRADAMSRYDDIHFKKGHVEDVVFNKPSPLLTFKKLVEQTSQNCITRSQRASSVCEDHLIKRLSQDATEGRTVKDVGRRVCCALFSHRDCIDSVVLKHCPDSSPQAADHLLGSRKLDLTLSCQQFNKDGCNGSNTMQISPFLLCAVLFVSMIFN